MTIRDQLRKLPVFDRPLPDFDADQVPDEPVSLFVSWLGEAIDAKVVEPRSRTRRHWPARWRWRGSGWPTIRSRSRPITPSTS